jgi:hypothetical protein
MNDNISAKIYLSQKKILAEDVQGLVLQNIMTIIKETILLH